MNKVFAGCFGWIRELMDQDLEQYYPGDSVEYEILHKLKSNWKDDNGIELFKEVGELYGETAMRTVSDFIKLNNTRDWASIGEREAHEGTEIDDFIRVLWGPLKEMGFEYTFSVQDGVTQATVKKCPLFELAEITGMYEWMYHMACITDYYTTPAFSNKVGFFRTKTLMQGDEYCNHTYYLKNNITEDMLLGYCGLYCGNCPSYQKTNSAKEVAFNKEDFYEPCQGCNSRIKTNHCSNCDIMKCNRSKNIRTCYACKDFPCEMMEGFIHDERYPYHQFVEKNMKLLQEIGLPKWQTVQKEKYICNQCEIEHNFFQTKCMSCGEPLKL